MKRYKLREYFSIEQNGEIVIGPCEIELSDEEAAQNTHKLEEVNPPAPTPESKKAKGKKESEE